jgi:UDP-galactose transporter B1
LIVERSRRGGKGGFKTLVGWEQEAVTAGANGSAANGSSDEKTAAPLAEKQLAESSWTRTLPVLLLRVGICQSLAAPIGFMSLRYISYPTMVLAKVSPEQAAEPFFAAD